MKRLVLNLAVAFVMVIIVTVNLCIDSNSYKLPGIKFANKVALADNENGWGLLYKKQWVSCNHAGQIIVHNSCGSVSIGIYAYSTQLISALNSCSYSYTVIPPSDGQKSYCYDGWGFCGEDDCR